MSDHLIFIHIPKTAGSTFLQVVKRQYRKNEFLYLHLTEEDKVFLDAMTDDEKRGIKCLSGHIRYGYHRFLPGSCDYITFLRHPVKRVVSLYYYILRNKHHYFHERMVSEKLSLEGFVNLPTEVYVEISNQQTDLLSSYPEPGNPFDTAKDNISKFLFTGITERFDESLVLLSRKAGWRNIYYNSSNISKNYEIGQVLTDKVKERILERNDLDMRLYTFASELFERAIAEYGSSFEDDLRWFRWKNRLYQKAMNLFVRQERNE